MREFYFLAESGGERGQFEEKRIPLTRNFNAAGGCWVTPRPARVVAAREYVALLKRHGPFHPLVTHGGILAQAAIASRIGTKPSNLIARASGMDAIQRMWDLAAHWAQTMRSVLPGIERTKLLTSDSEYPGAREAFDLYFVKQAGCPVDVEALDTSCCRTDPACEDIYKQIMTWVNRLGPHAIGLVFLSHVSYRTGTVLPVQRISRYIKALRDRVLIILDCAQSFGHVPVTMDKELCDLAVFCPHKWISAPQAGYLFVGNQRLRQLQQEVFGEIDLACDMGVGTAGTQDRARYLVVKEAIDYYWRHGGHSRTIAIAHEINRLVRNSDRFRVISPPPEFRTSSAIVAIAIDGLHGLDYEEIKREFAERFRLQVEAVGKEPAFEGAGSGEWVLRLSPDWRLRREDLTDLRHALNWLSAQVGGPAAVSGSLRLA